MKFNPRELIALLARIDITIERQGEYLKVTPRSRLTDEIVAALLRHKPALMPIVPKGRDDESR